MASNVSIMARLSDWLGPELYTACRENNVSKVESLTSPGVESSKWSAAILTAASEQGTAVAEFCLKNNRNQLNLFDSIGKRVLGNEALEPAYRFLVDSNLMDPEHRIEWMGQLLGLGAGSSLERGPRHSLVEYLLSKGIDPNQRVEMYGNMYALTAAAGWADKRMLGILLDHGATIDGSGALIYAAEKGKKENAKYLLDRGANVNEMVPLEKSLPGMEATCAALHAAAENSHVEVIDVLIDAGADVQLKDAKGRTAGEVARAKGMDDTILAKLS